MMLLYIDEKDSRPIYRQLAVRVKDQVSKGLLEPGDELPSVRELSDNLGINLHTVRRAYRELRDQGIVDLRLGRRARISRMRKLPPDNTAVTGIRTRLNELVTDALLTGITPADFVHMVNEQLKTQNTGKKE